MRETQELVTIVPWTFIATICNLFIQCWLIKKFLFKPIREVIEKRRALADSQIQDAKKAKETASVILQDAQKDAAARSEAMLQEAKAQAAGIKAKAEADILQEKKKAVNEIKNEIGGIAMDIAGKVIEREISEDDHRKLIDEFIENVGEAS